MTRPSRLSRAGAWLPLALCMSAPVLYGIGGCARYLEAQAHRVISPDPRVMLDHHQRLSLTAREAPGYRCPNNFTMLCERGGAITLSCTCFFNP